MSCRDLGPGFTSGGSGRASIGRRGGGGTNAPRRAAIWSRPAEIALSPQKLQPPLSGSGSGSFLLLHFVCAYSLFAHYKRCSRAPLSPTIVLHFFSHLFFSLLSTYKCTWTPNDTSFLYAFCDTRSDFRQFNFRRVHNFKEYKLVGILLRVAQRHLRCASFTARLTKSSFFF